ncbi:MAG TPA: ABC transporter permease [Acidimicrobiia bacterium]|nr:ABC transporter permease [Acidimicrobiia bacterium]
MNPVLSREILERFRGRRSALLMFFWTLGIGLVGYVVYLVGQEVASNFFGLGRLITTGFVGRFLFQGMVLLMVTAVVMVVPGITALAIVGERERQTLGLLQVTQLTPFQLVLGKLTSSLSYFLLLVVAVAPIIALPLLFGGMSLGDIFAGLGMMLLTATMVGSVSLAISARARSSRGAVAGSYAFSFVIAFFSVAMILAELLIFRGSTNEIIPPRGREIYSSWINPYVATVDAVVSPLSLRNDGQFTPFTPAEALLFSRQGVRRSLGGVGFAGGEEFGRGIPFGGMPFDGGIVGPEQEVRLRRGPVWIRTVVLYVVISGLALLRATRIVTAPALAPTRSKKLKNATT